MVDKITIDKLIEELEKTGNIYASCKKVGVSPAQYYRGFKNDPHFRKRADRAIRVGRSNSSDIAEYALMGEIKKGKMDAIKYFLSHNSPRYKAKHAPVVIVHKRIDHVKDIPKNVTIEDLLDEYEEKADQENKKPSSAGIIIDEDGNSKLDKPEDSNS